MPWPALTPESFPAIKETPSHDHGGLLRLLGPSTGPVTGATGAGQVPSLVQFGSHVGTTAADGRLTVTFPTPFPHAVIAVIVGDGDAEVVSLGKSFGVYTTAVNQFVATVTDAAGARLNTQTVRANWVAFGI